MKLYVVEFSNGDENAANQKSLVEADSSASAISKIGEMNENNRVVDTMLISPEDASLNIWPLPPSVD